MNILITYLSCLTYIYAHITHTQPHTQIYFFSILPNYLFFGYLAWQYGDTQAFQKSSGIHAQLNHFILHSLSSSWKLTIDHFTLVFDPHQLRQGVFPDVSVLGCCYKKTQHK